MVIGKIKKIALCGMILLFSCGTGENHKLYLNKKLKPILLQSDVQNYLDSIGTGFISTPKNIFIFMVDTLREDYLTPELAPHIHKFKKESLHSYYGISGATATHHSFFSFFYSRPAYERNMLIRSGYTLGSTTLNILKKGGYNIYGYGCPSYLFKLNNTISKHDVLSDYSQMQLIFAENSSLVSDSTLKSDNYGSTSGEEDNFIINKIISKIGDLSINLSNNNNIVFSYLCSAHTPYSWSNNITYIDTPNYDFSQNSLDKDLEKPSDDLRLRLKNSYRNAVRGVDYQFNRLITYLKSSNQYDNSIIVLLSDHGELLFENNYFSHGKTSRQETSIVPIYIKLGLDSGHFKGSAPHISSLMDVFPTIFDYLGIGDYGANFFFGESLMNHSGYGAISVTPNSEKDTHQMTLYNDRYKAIIEIESDPTLYGNLLDAQNIIIKDIRNYNDQQIDLGEDFKETKKRLENDFSLLFSKMFQ